MLDASSRGPAAPDDLAGDRAHQVQQVSNDARDPSTSTTRERILDAASRELARTGFAGARMESIAEAAGIRKQVIYYYFPSKADLARAVLTRSNRRAAEFWASFGSASLEEIMHAAIVRARDFPHEVAHLLWEGQEYQNHLGLPVTMEPSRERDLRLVVELIERSQSAGDIDAGLPSDLLGLAVVLLSLGPPAYPQVVPVVTGEEWSSPDFTQRWALFCTEAVRRLTRSL